MHGIKFMQLAKLQDFLCRPRENEPQIRESYQRLGLDLQLLDKTSTTMHLATPRVQAHTQGLYCFVLSHAILLNTIMIRALEPRSVILAQEAEKMIDTVLILAKDSLHFRPVGSSVAATMLIAVWACASSRRPEIEGILTDMMRDFPMADWRESAQWLDDAMHYHCKTPERPTVLPVRNSQSTACVVM